MEDSQWSLRGRIVTAPCLLWHHIQTHLCTEERTIAPQNTIFKDTPLFFSPSSWSSAHEFAGFTLHINNQIRATIQNQVLKLAVKMYLQADNSLWAKTY